LVNRKTDQKSKLSVRLTAPIVEWYGDRGYGFLEHGSVRVFLHISDFSRRGKYPRIGDMIQFKMGRDSRGRNCAVDASQHREHSRSALGSLFVLGLLLIVPGLSIKRFALDPKILFGYLAGISMLTWAAYGHDKNRAQCGGWRVPESTLHLFEFAGGWPAAFLAQRYFRHKTSKGSFKRVFWLIVLIQQYAALDSLQHWRFTLAALSLATKMANR
jgi:uncharacterized membrane protein YsdA (DUF1294 family)/cold shock CspA family protein